MMPPVKEIMSSKDMCILYSSGDGYTCNGTVVSQRMVDRVDANDSI